LWCGSHLNKNNSYHEPRSEAVTHPRLRRETLEYKAR
jgi:hypothetical protein